MPPSISRLAMMLSVEVWLLWVSQGRLREMHNGSSVSPIKGRTRVSLRFPRFLYDEAGQSSVPLMGGGRW